ncbi:MAG: DUF6516 family protein [Sulfuricaulis sp.]|uniref:toxin-antitoxin system TumE family protein n=1 Tax=Sulfuricaulis sp. TaxID=2003553 RepID=UPI0034A5BE8F
MRARLLFDQRIVIAETAFAELVLWEVPTPVRGSQHSYKYRLAFVVDGRSAVRYDNEAGKGDHRHVGDVEEPYLFTTPDQLVNDFFLDIERWRNENRNS